MIQSWARQTPDAVALLAPGRKPLSFGGLLQQMEATDKALDRCGVCPNEVVALAMPDGPEMAAAVVGIVRKRACAPLNPSLAAPEFESCLLSLRPAALMMPLGSESPAAAAVRFHGIPILDVFTEPDAPAGLFKARPRSEDLPTQRRNAAGVALLLFTSATTGRPKLVPLSHENISAISRFVRLVLQLRSDDRFLSCNIGARQ